MFQRLPDLVDSLHKDPRFSDTAKQNLAALKESLPHGMIRSLKDELAPDFGAWQQQIEWQRDETWLTANWFSILFIRITFEEI